MAGTIAKANVGGDIAAGAGDASDQLREIRRQIRATEKELTDLAARGIAVSDTTAKRLQELQRREAATNAIVQRQKNVARNAKRALDMGEMTKAILGASSIKNILAGNADARDFASLAFLAERQIVKGVKQIAGVKVARAARGVLKAVPFVGEAVGSLLEGWEKKKALEKSSDEINQLARAGKIDPATSRLYYASLTEGWFNDPKATVNNVMDASRGLMRLQANEMQGVLESVKVKRSYATDEVSAEAGVVYSTTEESLSAKDVLRRYNERLEQDRANGVIITKHTQEDALRTAISSMLEDDDQRDVIAEKLIEQVKKKLIEKSDDGEYLVATKFHREEAERQMRVASMRHAVPAKLEF